MMHAINQFLQLKKKKPYPPIQFVRIFVYSIRALLLVMLKSYIAIFSTIKIKIGAPLVEPKPLYYQSVWIVDCGGI